MNGFLRATALGVALGVVSVLSLNSAVQAATPGSATSGSGGSVSTLTESVDARLLAAQDLLVAMQAKQMFKSQFEASLPRQMAGIQKEYPDMSKQTRDMIENAFREETDRSLDGLMHDIASLYAKRFSVDEMRTIATFHRTKAGTKLRSESEALQRELSGVANTWSLDVVRKISKRLQDQLRSTSPTSKYSS